MADLYRFKSDAAFGGYLEQLEEGGLSGNITRWMVEGYDHIIIGDNLPAPNGNLSNGYVITKDDESAVEFTLNNISLPPVLEVRNKGAKFVLAGLGGELISDEALAVIDSMPNALTATERGAIIEFVNSQSSSLGNGNWALIDSFAHFALQDPVNAVRDWKRESTMANVGAAHTPGIGFVFSGAEWIASNYNATLDAVNFEQDNALMGMFFVDQTGNFISGSQQTSPIAARIYLRHNNGSYSVSINDADERNDIGISSLNETLWIASRENATEKTSVVNGVKSTAFGSNSTTILNENILIGGRSLNDGNPTANILIGTVSSFILGAGIGFDNSGYYNELIKLNNTL